MIVTIKINPKLHTPMYLFLSHLSFVDFCYSSIVAPKTMVNLINIIKGNETMDLTVTGSL